MLRDASNQPVYNDTYSNLYKNMSVTLSHIIFWTEHEWEIIQKPVVHYPGQDE